MSRMSPASEEVGVFGCLFVCLCCSKGKGGGLIGLDLPRAVGVLGRFVFCI